MQESKLRKVNQFTNNISKDYKDSLLVFLIKKILNCKL